MIQTDPTTPFASVPVLDALLPKVRVIGVGEATHGTKEAFELKHKLIRYLAEYGWLKTLCLECGFLPARHIDRYIRFGEGNAKDALIYQGYWVWNAVEVLSLIEWLHTFNMMRPMSERIRFVGIDCQNVEPEIPAVVTALADTSGVSKALRTQLKQFAEDELQDVMVLKALLQVAVDQHLADPLTLKNIWYYLDVYKGDSLEEGLTRRDAYMTQMLLETAGDTGTVVWAHNEHIANNPDFFGTKVLGWYLREALGSGYLSVGMFFGEGAFRARSLAEAERPIKALQIGRPPAEFWEWGFLDRPLGLYPSATYPTHPAQFRRFIGTLFDPNEPHSERFRVARPPQDFDIITWIPETQAATGIEMHL
jgi:erythromycin esterase